jgi:antitoxin PrlF
VRIAFIRARAPHSLRIPKVPSRKAPFGERDCRYVTTMGTIVKRLVTAGLVSRKTASHITAMNRQTRQPSAFSKVSVKSQTVIPREVRERLRLKPGDTLRYRITEEGVLLEKAPANEADDPFATFSEWSNEADEKAYGGL